eukprot:scaffold28677_cov112-Isochrysis_galbana.AAC.3
MAMGDPDRRPADPGRFLFFKRRPRCRMALLELFEPKKSSYRVHAARALRAYAWVARPSWPR